MLQDLYLQINSPDVNLPGAVAKLLLSMLLGAIIGIERRRKGQIAGLRTFALISMGATLDDRMYRASCRCRNVSHQHHCHPAHHLYSCQH